MDGKGNKCQVEGSERRVEESSETFLYYDLKPVTQIGAISS